MIDGALLFGRYAFAPNRLGYCGPADHQALFDYVTMGHTDQGLIELERRFEGAYPYLKLIAHANNIADPFDGRVVEAYWLGNDLLERVDAVNFYASLGQRFKSRMTTKTFGWLGSKLEFGARPHHNFHVFEVYVRAGLMHDAHAPIILETMDACRISWGTVIAVEGAELVIDRSTLAWQGGKIALAEPSLARVMRQIDGRGFADAVRPGEIVSVHWNWACQILPPHALKRLIYETKHSIALANLTM